MPNVDSVYYKSDINSLHLVLGCEYSFESHTNFNMVFKESLANFLLISRDPSIFSIKDSLNTQIGT